MKIPFDEITSLMDEMKQIEEERDRLETKRHEIENKGIQKNGYKIPRDHKCIDRFGGRRKIKKLSLSVI